MKGDTNCLTGFLAVIVVCFPQRASDLWGCISGWMCERACACMRLKMSFVPSNGTVGSGVKLNMKGADQLSINIQCIHVFLGVYLSQCV